MHCTIGARRRRRPARAPHPGALGEACSGPRRRPAGAGAGGGLL